MREQGTHQERLAVHGVYFKLFELQYKTIEKNDESDSGTEVSTSASSVP